jgi:hypothetical protein
MGESFTRLPPAVRDLHGNPDGIHAKGRCDVRRGGGVLSRVLGRMLGVPEAGDALDLDFRIFARDGVELWVRRFGHSVMRSRFWNEGGVLYERLGPIVMSHSLVEAGGILETRLAKLWFLGLPVPRAFHPRIRALASQDGDAYLFDVAAEMPVAGLVVGYRGHLRPVTGHAP